LRKKHVFDFLVHHADWSKEDIMGISKVVKKYKINEQPNDFAYWQSKSYEERLEALAWE